MRGMCVVVPQKLISIMLEELHTILVGINKMKVVARSFVWWPLINKENEKLAWFCDVCLSVGHGPPSSPLHP